MKVNVELAAIHVLLFHNYVLFHAIKAAIFAILIARRILMKPIMQKTLQGSWRFASLI